MKALEHRARRRQIICTFDEDAPQHPRLMRRQTNLVHAGRQLAFESGADEYEVLRSGTRGASTHMLYFRVKVGDRERVVPTRGIRRTNDHGFIA